MEIAESNGGFEFRINNPIENIFLNGANFTTPLDSTQMSWPGQIVFEIAIYKTYFIL